MWTADRWTDYEVIDTSDGEKLERWGKYMLLRPDPQVIWKSDKRSGYWRKPNAHYHRSQKGGGEWEFFDLPEQWSIDYHLPEGVSSLNNNATHGDKLTFNLKPFAFKHTGLFPEQATNWDEFSRLISKRRLETGRAPKVLNLFAYTGYRRDEKFYRCGFSWPDAERWFAGQYGAQRGHQRIGIDSSDGRTSGLEVCNRHYAGSS